MSDPIALPLPRLKRVWKVRYADSIEAPTVSAAILVRAETVFDAVTIAKKTTEFQAFKNQFSNGDVVVVEFQGNISA